MNLRHLTATALTTIGLAAGLVAIAPAAQAATEIQLETDPISLFSADRLANATGTANLVLASDRIGLRIAGTLTLRGGSAGCASAWVRYQEIYTHATWGGPSSWRETPVLSRVCGGDSAALRVSVPGDILRYTVVVARSPQGTAADPFAGETTYATQEHYVGDAPDSLGTVSRLDRDPTSVQVQSGTGVHAAFEQALVDYRLSVRGDYFSGGYYIPLTASVLSRVQGDLIWHATLGQTAYVRVTWTYADGTVSVRDTGSVSAASPRLHVDVESPDLAAQQKTLDVVSTRISVRSGSIEKGAAPYGAFLDGA